MSTLAEYSSCKFFSSLFHDFHIADSSKIESIEEQCDFEVQGEKKSVSKEGHQRITNFFSIIVLKNWILICSE